MKLIRVANEDLGWGELSEEEWGKRGTKTN
jgi:hypothetical protein